jgi:hypothetical protein
MEAEEVVNLLNEAVKNLEEKLSGRGCIALVFNRDIDHFSMSTNIAAEDISKALRAVADQIDVINASVTN